MTRPSQDNDADSIVRWFYLSLYASTALAGATWWSQRDESPRLFDLVGARYAQAQFPPVPGLNNPPSNTQPFGQSITPPVAGPAVSRPVGWVGGPNAAPPPAVPVTGPNSSEEQIEGAKKIAQVGTEFILLADVLGPVNDILNRNADQVKRMSADQLETLRNNLIKQRLEQLIETKMVLADAKRKVAPEAYKKIQSKIDEQFDSVEVVKAMERSGVKTRAELDAQLRQAGSSLEREKRVFAEKALSMSWIQQGVKVDEEYTHEQMLTYYQTHAAEYEYTARARWQQFQVRVDKFPNKQAAYAAIAQAGNQIAAGADFAEVAKKLSQGFTADKGGLHDWTTQGSLSATAIDQAVFTLPIGQLSPIIDDGRSFHIIKVLERQNAGKRPFIEVQNEIKQKIRQERMNDAASKYLTELKNNTKVWTIYDAQPSISGAQLSTRPYDHIPLNAQPVVGQPLIGQPLQR